MRAVESERHYGTDSTDEFDTLAEATVDEDGSVHIETVIVDKREPPGVALLRWVCVPWLIPRVRQDETTAEKETK